MRPDFDLLIIGGGSAGLTAATTGAGLGARVGLIEAGRLGGDCTWTGCVPSKALIHAAGITHHAMTSPWLTRPEITYPNVAARVAGAIEAVAGRETASVLARAGVEVIVGDGRIVGARTIVAGSRSISAARVIICTGAAPHLPPITGLEESRPLTYRNVFELESLPKHLIVLGAGTVGVELAQACARLGSAVILVDEADRLLTLADPDASAVLARVFSDEGIDVRLNLRVDRVERRQGRFVVGAGALEIEGDGLLVATGRRPLLTGLGLDQVGIAHDANGIRVDRRLATSVTGFFAAGDVTGGPQFTHYAGWQGFAAARNALLPGWEAGVRSGIPWTVFTDPAVAGAGAGLGAGAGSGSGGGDAGGARGLKEHRIDLAEVDRADTEGSPAGFIKLMVDGDILRGATVVAPNAGELINELSLAIQTRARVSELARTIHAYPTYGSAIQILAGRISMARRLRGGRRRLAGWFIRQLGNK